MSSSQHRTSLKSERVASALASAGCSDSIIHERVLSELETIGARGHVLDFGAGSGALTARLSACGWFTRISAADIAEYRRPISDDVDWIYVDLNDPLPVPDSSFDVIVAVEVIEHLENPRGVAREWNRILKSGGLLLATTPNVESWRSLLSLIVRGHFIAFTGDSYPAHITALTRTDLRRLLTEAGFTDIRFFWSDYGVIPRMTSVSWQRITGGRLTGARYSDNVGVVARRI